jgi:hypothetical protein
MGWKNDKDRRDLNECEAVKLEMSERLEVWWTTMMWIPYVGLGR